MGILRDIKHSLGLKCKYLGSDFCDCSYPDCFKHSNNYYGDCDAGCIRQAEERKRLSMLDDLIS